MRTELYKVVRLKWGPVMWQKVEENVRLWQLGKGTTEEVRVFILGIVVQYFVSAMVL